MTNEARFLKKKKKKIGDPNFGQMGQKWAGNQFFCHFVKFGSLVFLEIAYNDSLQQCIRSSRGKTHEKGFGDHLWSKSGPKSCPKLGFWSFPEVWFISFTLNCIG